MPVNVSPKYWAEHLGLPYHQTTIRELEMPVEGKTGRGLMTLSEGSLSYTRYGYGDLLPRRSEVHRSAPRLFRHAAAAAVRGSAVDRSVLADVLVLRIDGHGSDGAADVPRAPRNRHCGNATQRLRGRAARDAMGLGEILDLVSDRGDA